MIKEKHFVLTGLESRGIEALAKPYGKSMRAYCDTHQFIQEILPSIKRLLPKDILSAIDDMSSGDGFELITISNLPTDSELPKHGGLEDKVSNKTRVSEVCLLAINALLGGRFQKEESSHQLGYIHQITPVSAFLNEASGRGGGSIPFHAENMFIKNSPSFLSLFCLQGERGVATEYLYVSDIVRRLSSEVLACLREPIFTIVSGDGFNKKELLNSPVIDALNNDWIACRFYEEDRIFSSSAQGQWAIQQLHKAIRQAKESDAKAVELSRGTLLLFSNAIRKGRCGGVLHGRRGEMAVKKSPTSSSPRWLQRVCIELSY